MKIKTILICILATGVIPVEVFPQSVTGKLRNKQTLEVVAAANIQVFGTPFGTSSDDEGEFTIENLPSGNYILRISSIGFITREIEINLENLSLDLGIIDIEPGIYRLNREIVVSALRILQIQYESPQSISVLSQAELIMTAPRSSAEALFGLPGIFLQKTNHGGGSPIIRGLTGNQSLQMIDGIRLNNAISRYGPNQYFNTIDPNCISQIEVIRGAGSVQYGSDAMGGTIQVITKSPRFFADGFHAEGNLYGKLMSSGMEQSGRTELELGSRRVAFFGGYSLRNFGDLTGGVKIGRQDPTGYKEMSADLKASYRIAENQIFTLAYQFMLQDDVDRWDQVVQRGYHLWKFDPQNRYLAYARWDDYTTNKWFRHIRATASLNRSEEQRVSRPEGSSILTKEQDNITTYGFIAEATSQPSSGYRINSGIEYYHDVVQGSSSQEDMGTGERTEGRGAYPSGAQALNLAFFSLHTFDFRKFNFTYGIRINHFRVTAIDDAFGDIRNTSTALVGNLGISYALTPGFEAVASVNSGFRAPNIDDLTKFGRFDSGFEVPISNLKPEKSLSAEIGFKAFTDQFSGSAVIFRNNLFDLIDRVRATYLGSNVYQGDTVYRKGNADQAYIQGAELETAVNLVPNLSAFGSLMYTFGSTIEGEPLRRIPPLKGRIGLEFKNSEGYYVRPEFLFARKQDRLAKGDISDHRIPAGGTPGWMVFNLYAGMTIGRLSLNAGILNLFDETYKTHGSGVYGYGRCAQLAARFNF